MSSKNYPAILLPFSFFSTPSPPPVCYTIWPQPALQPHQFFWFFLIIITYLFQFLKVFWNLQNLSIEIPRSCKNSILFLIGLIVLVLHSKIISLLHANLKACETTRKRIQILVDYIFQHRSNIRTSPNHFWAQFAHEDPAVPLIAQ